jgi:spore germination protein KC
MKRRMVCLLLILSLFMSGCFAYKDINRLLFVTGLLIDIDKDKNIILYTEAFVAARSSGEKMGEEERIVFRSKSKTLLEAARDINLSSSFRLNYTQNRAIIFTERAAKHGIDNFIDLLDRDQQTTLRQFLFVYPGDPEELMQTKLKEEPFIGIFLSDLVLNQKITSKATQKRFDDYLNNRLMGSRVDVINMIDKDGHPGERISIKGLAVMKDDKMVGSLNSEEVLAYNFLKGVTKFGGIEITNPEHEDKYASLKILNSKTRSVLSYDGEIVHLNKNINVRTNFGETQESIHLTDDKEREIIDKYTENRIKNMCIELFNAYKQKDIDLLNVQEDFNRRYPNTNIKDFIKIVQLNVDARVHMEGSTDKTDFR